MGGRRSRCLNSGYHNLGLLQVNFFFLALRPNAGHGLLILEVC